MNEIARLRRMGRRQAEIQLASYANQQAADARANPATEEHLIAFMEGFVLRMELAVAIYTKAANDD